MKTGVRNLLLLGVVATRFVAIALGDETDHSDPAKRQTRVLIFPDEVPAGDLSPASQPFLATLPNLERIMLDGHPITEAQLADLKHALQFSGSFGCSWEQNRADQGFRVVLASVRPAN